MYKTQYNSLRKNYMYFMFKALNMHVFMLSSNNNFQYFRFVIWF